MRISSTSAQRRRMAAAAAFVLLAIVGCSKPGNDFGESHTPDTGIPSGASVQTLPPLPAPWAELDRTNVTAVANAAMTALFDWNPENGDTGPESAAHRAAPLFTPRAAADYRPYPIPRVTWQDWMDTATTITAATTITSETHPPDTDVSWQRKTATTITVNTPGKSPRTITVISLLRLQKQPVWTITGVSHLQ
ncbi:hypothetical protein AB0C65_35690 [Nocardia sp. NPDC048505]|uniref:hypothetical protein n=1 Tax=Nocardia sp. NPDC048505 TaxID=3155756 RepID=UPI0033C182EC